MIRFIVLCLLAVCLLGVKADEKPHLNSERVIRQYRALQAKEEELGKSYKFRTGPLEDIKYSGGTKFLDETGATLLFRANWDYYLEVSVIHQQGITLLTSVKDPSAEILEELVQLVETRDTFRRSGEVDMRLASRSEQSKPELMGYHLTAIEIMAGDSIDLTEMHKLRDATDWEEVAEAFSLFCSQAHLPVSQRRIVGQSLIKRLKTESEIEYDTNFNSVPKKK